MTQNEDSMAGRMDSDELQLLIAGYVLCDLDPEEVAAFEQQLAIDPALAEAVAEMQQALERAYDTPEVAPPTPLRSALLAAHTRPEPQAPAPSVVGQRRRPGWNLGWGIAAAVIAGLSLNNYRLWREVQGLRGGPPGPALAFTLRSTDVALGASAQVVVNPNTLQATLTVEGLPPLPPGQVYVLWTLVEPNAPFTADEKNAILTQVFTVDDQGQRVEDISVPQAFRTPETVTAVAITVESANAPQRHVATPILIERL